MPLLDCQSLTKSHGSRTLFEGVTFTIEKGDRIGLIGPNGSGKSTFLKVVAGMERPDTGEIVCQRDLRIGYVPQVSSYDSRPVFDQVCDVEDMEMTTRASIVLGKMGFEDFDQPADTLSGGWRKRLDIAKELVAEPDLLLLDEPTNHLDVETIEWLEAFLIREHLTYILISHDRYFLEAVTNRVIEFNPRFPQGVFSVDGPYSLFLERRDEFYSAQAERQKSLNSKVRREIDWLRQSPKARTTKSRSRVQEAHRLIGELGEIKTRNNEKRSHIDFVGTGRESRRLLVGSNLRKRELFSGLDIVLSPGKRIGIVGGNGTGKTTLLKMLADEIEPDQGTIKRADALQVVYFDQHRDKLPMDMPLKEALCPSGEEVIYRGRHIHVNGWAKRFLFSQDRLELPIGYLSGGERARVLIARLMLQPADIMLLDEPTNDLDIPTLELLEESLQEFPGAIVLITHDRYLLDQVASEVIGLGCGSDNFYFADSRQWESYRDSYTEEKKPKAEKPKPVAKEASKRKLSYKEKKELETMEEDIQAAEERLVEAQNYASQSDVASNARKLAEACRSMQQAEDRVNDLYARWEELERLRDELT